MRNIDTLRHFMRYFEPHCLERDGQRVCYVSALEYPDKQDALDVLGENGFFRDAPASIVLKYAGLSHAEGEERWIVTDEERPMTYPVWVAW